MKYNKREIMLNAWTLARNLAEINGGKPAQYIATGMRASWDQARAVELINSTAPTVQQAEKIMGVMTSIITGEEEKLTRDQNHKLLRYAYNVKHTLHGYAQTNGSVIDTGFVIDFIEFINNGNGLNAETLEKFIAHEAARKAARRAARAARRAAA